MTINANTTFLVLTTLTQNVFFVRAPTNAEETFVTFHMNKNNDKWLKMEQLDKQLFRYKCDKEDLLMYKLKFVTENNCSWETPNWKIISDYKSYSNFSIDSFRICLSNGCDE